MQAEKAALSKLATGNRFGAMESDEEEEDGLAAAHMSVFGGCQRSRARLRIENREFHG